MSFPARRALTFHRRLATSAGSTPSLLGTAPHHHLYILLRSQHPPRTFPSRVPSTLQPALQRLVAPWSGLVNFMYTTDLPAPQTTLTGPPLGLQEPNPEETYEAFAYAPGRAPLHLPRVAHDTLAAVSAQLGRYVSTPRTVVERYDGPIHLYVCTHGARDCRCGDVGGDVADALRNCATSARTRTPGGIWDRVVVGEVSHVGGHRHAANMLVFPHGEWLGGLQARDLGAGPRVLDRIVESTPSLFDGSEKNPLCPEHWRGRMGLSKADQLHLYESRLLPLERTIGAWTDDGTWERRPRTTDGAPPELALAPRARR